MTALGTGWGSWLARATAAIVLFELVSGLAITFGPFHPAVEWGLLLHTAAGLIALAPLAWYFVRHWEDYSGQAMSDVLLLGYVGLAAMAICVLSGLVVTWQGLLATPHLSVAPLSPPHLNPAGARRVSTAHRHLLVSPPGFRRSASSRRLVRLRGSGFSGSRGYGSGSDAGLLGRQIPEPVPGRLQLPLRQNPAVCAKPRQDIHQRRLRRPVACRIGNLRLQRLPHTNLR